MTAAQTLKQRLQEEIEGAVARLEAAAQRLAAAMHDRGPGRPAEDFAALDRDMGTATRELAAAQSRAVWFNKRWRDTKDTRKLTCPDKFVVHDLDVIGEDFELLPPARVKAVEELLAKASGGFEGFAWTWQVSAVATTNDAGQATGPGIMVSGRAPITDSQRAAAEKIAPGRPVGPFALWPIGGKGLVIAAAGVQPGLDPKLAGEALRELLSTWQEHGSRRASALQDDGSGPPWTLSRQIATVAAEADDFYLRRFNGAAHVEPDGQIRFGSVNPCELGPALPDAIWQARVEGESLNKRQLPIPQRTIFGSLVRVPFEARRSSTPDDPPVKLDAEDGSPLTVRKFMPWVMGGRVDSGKEMLRRLRQTRQTLRELDVPYEWNGLLWERQIVIMDVPLSGTWREVLDEKLPLFVHLPPGDGTGPRVWDRDLFLRLMLQDSACFRLLVNLMLRWHVEGARVVPVDSSRKKWRYTTDPRQYDRFSDREAERFAFPEGTGPARRDHRRTAGWGAVERLLKLGGAVHVDGRLLPPLPGLRGEDLLSR